MRNFFSILLFVAAGFGIYLFSLTSFLNSSRFDGKRTILLVSIIPLSLVLLSAYRLSSKSAKLKYAGLTLILSTGFTAFQLFTFLCIQFDPAVQDLVKIPIAVMFNDYRLGIPLLIGLFILGVPMVRKPDREFEDNPRQ
jgi:hypothetical protein